MTSVPVTHLRRTRCWRIIPSRFPPVDLFREIAPPEHWAALQELEGATNERLRDATIAGFIRPEDCVERSGSHYIMGPLTHPNPQGSRFSDGSFGVVYAALEFDTAIAEVKAQREEFLRRTSEEPQRIDMRAVVMELEGELHDIRGDPTYLDGEAGRHLARALREAGSSGLLFDSSQKPGGTCVCVFRPPVLSKARQERHFAFVWDGKAITDVLKYASIV